MASCLQYPLVRMAFQSCTIFGSGTAFSVWSRTTQFSGPTLGKLTHQQLDFVVEMHAICFRQCSTLQPVGSPQFTSRLSKIVWKMGIRVHHSRYALSASWSSWSGVALLFEMFTMPDSNIVMLLWCDIIWTHGLVICSCHHFSVISLTEKLRPLRSHFMSPVQTVYVSDDNVDCKCYMCFYITVN